MTFDCAFTNGKIVDGTGNPWFFGDVGVSDGKLITIGRNLKAEAEETIDIKGFVITPGFIDPHSHTELPILKDPLNVLPKTLQGITTEVVGHCGLAPAPVSDENKDYLRRLLDPVIGNFEVPWNWNSLDEFMGQFDGKLISNLGFLVAHGALRVDAVADLDRAALSEEIQSMKRLLQDGLDAGALGFSTGLAYPSMTGAGTEELIELIKVVAASDGVFSIHMRHRFDMYGSLVETLKIAETTRVSLQISHLQFDYSGSDRPPEVALVEDAREDGVEVSFDLYPYTGGATMLSLLFPPELYRGGHDAFLNRIKDPHVRKTIKAEIGEIIDWGKVIFSAVRSRKGIEGMTLREVAVSEGVHPVDLAADLLIESSLDVNVVVLRHDRDPEESIKKTMAHRLHLFMTDSILYGSHPHPRGYGTYPRVLSKYVQEEKILTLEEAVRKMTSFPASKFRVSLRGLIKEGYFADLVVFDPKTIKDTSDFTSPKNLPLGIEYVMVNGELVTENGEYLQSTPGMVIRK